MSATDEVVSHLRGLRSSCAQGMAWSSALIWGEKAVLLSGAIDDVLWMANALVTNGQYRQAEELLVNPRYAKLVRSSHAGRYLACVVAMRLGRAEAALELINTDTALLRSTNSLNDMAQTPTAKHSAKVSQSPVTLFADQPAASPSVNTSDATETSVPLDPRAWMLYMQGACVIQLSNVGATDETPSIKRMQLQSAGSDRLVGMDAIVARMWTQALHVDARCWEAWTGLREYGLLTPNEETELVRAVDWTSCCGSDVVARFFRDYCLATQTSISQTSGDMSTVGATHRLLTSFPQLMHDPSLRTIQAARLLAHGQARSALSYTVQVLEHRRVPDPSATSIHITALTTLRAKEALFRIAHELAEEFGLSAVKRADIEPHDTVGTQNVGAATAGTGRLRTGARGLLVPETPTRSTAPVFGVQSGKRASGAASSVAVAHMVGQTASAASNAAWRGLWGLPTWTQPGPPILATYPCALGPASSVPVSSESVLNTFTTSSAQAASGPQYEFVGASLAWYAIGCYYLVSAELTIRPNVASHEWAQTAGPVTSPNGPDSAHMRDTPRVSPEASHLIDEARRWLAKTTMASPRSVVAWTAFAHTFVVSGEWESATRALHTAVALCGCERAVHNAPECSTPSKHTAEPDVGRGSRLAHVPLASLGSVYLQLGDLNMAESCLHASALHLTGLTPLKWASLWRPMLNAVNNTECIEWCKTHCLDSEPSDRLQVLADAHLLNDVGMLYYANNDLSSARAMFMLALLALNHQIGQHHTLHTLFNPRARPCSRLSPELRAYNAVVLTNLGNTLRRLNSIDGALVCLREAERHAPRDTNITLSIAYALHMQAIDEWDTCADMLDEAVDVYHRVLADRPGDPVATDLLTLALELSMRSVHIDTEQDEFALRSLDEIGLLSLDANIGSPSDAHTDTDEDSDEAMDIEEDSD
ncbi:anaphase-promoting complex subunit Cut9 [Coemansia sp. RSA 720]|nr:anaphase-promoting complex subunit Cut9 [Coemansia sp. RSA 720]